MRIIETVRSGFKSELNTNVFKQNPFHFTYVFFAAFKVSFSLLLFAQFVSCRVMIAGASVLTKGEFF